MAVIIGTMTNFDGHENDDVTCKLTFKTEMLTITYLCYMFYNVFDHFYRPTGILHIYMHLITETKDYTTVKDKQ